MIRHIRGAQQILTARTTAGGRSGDLAWLLVGLCASLGFVTLGCDPGGVGDPCIPEDEYRQQVAGYGVTEVNVESRSFQCETRVCLVNHFQGRVSCPYGQTEAVAGECGAPGAGAACADRGDACRVPGTDGREDDERIVVPVDPQLVDRRAEDSVYCSCRCDGPDSNARYCECPSGYACVELVEDLQLDTGQGAGNLAGSYCIKDGTRYDQTQRGGSSCDRGIANCGNDGDNP